jgi:hypothetical protein
MERKTNRVHQGEGQVRVMVRYEDINTASGTVECRVRQVKFLQELLDNPALLLCDLTPFQQMNMKHDGNRWIIQIEASVPKELSGLGH